MHRLVMTPMHDTFVAEVSAVNLQTLEAPDLLEQIRAGMDRYGVLVFRNQALTPAGQLAFAERLDGSIHRKTSTRVFQKNRYGDEALTDISNVGTDGEILERNDRKRMNGIANRLWHTDASFEDPAGRYSMLFGKHVPEVRADTQFADMRAAYEALDDAAREQIDGLHVHHSIVYSREVMGFAFSAEEAAQMPGAVHPLVRRFPETGRRSLYLASHASRIVEWPVPEGRLLIRDLIEHATQARFVYTHIWRPNDLVIWDNRTTMHRGRPFDDIRHRREMIRVTTLDVARVGSDAHHASS